MKINYPYPVDKQKYTGSRNPSHQLCYALYNWCNENNYKIYSYHINGVTSNFNLILDMIKAYGYEERWIYETVDGLDSAWVNETGVVRIEKSENYCYIYIDDVKPRKELRDVLDSLLKKRTVDKGVVFCLLKDCNGSISLEEIGVAGNPLEEINYSEDVIKKFKHVVKDIGSVDPCGRLTIIDGPPGTGKTFLVRSLLDMADKCSFVIIPPSMVSGLTGPDLLPVLLQETSYKETKIVFILEDADDCLAPRMADNMNTIGTLLNLADGILGKLLDVRIVATTNAKEVDLDTAIRRVGRLCQRIEVGLLSKEQAEKVFNKLAPNESMPKFKGQVTLAEVYSLARKGEANKEINNEIGFHKV